MSRWPDHLQPLKCQTCGSLDVRKHCQPPYESKTCNWWVCVECKSYGNTKRWATGRIA